MPRLRWFCPPRPTPHSSLRCPRACRRTDRPAPPSTGSAASVEAGTSPAQSSHSASTATGVCRKRSSISCAQASTSPSKHRGNLRRVALAKVAPAVGSWQKAIVAACNACSHCLPSFARCLCTCLCKRLRSAAKRASSAVRASMAEAWQVLEPRLGGALGQMPCMVSLRISMPWSSRIRRNADKYDRYLNISCRRRLRGSVDICIAMYACTAVVILVCL